MHALRLLGAACEQQSNRREAQTLPLPEWLQALPPAGAGASGATVRMPVVRGIPTTMLELAVRVRL